jgi:hypothetical protein
MKGRLREELNDLVEAIGKEAALKEVTAYINGPPKKGGRPPDQYPGLKDALVWAHMQFFIDYRVKQLDHRRRTQKETLKEAGRLLAEYISRFVSGGRKRRGGTFEKIYKQANARGRVESQFETLKQDCYGVLVHNVADRPGVSPIPPLEFAKGHNIALELIDFPACQFLDTNGIPVSMVLVPSRDGGANPTKNLSSKSSG